MSKTETPKKAATTKEETQIVASIPTAEKFPFSEKDIKDYLVGVWTTLSDSQFNLFYNIAKYSNLNPFKREIYAVAYNSYNKVKKIREPQLSIVTGYQVYVARADRSGKLKGWEVTIEEDSNEKVKSATVIIHRSGFDSPFKWTVLYKEEVKTDSEGNAKSWRATRPVFMLKKVAIGQGFRLAFPNELEGMPYLEEEVGENNYIEVKEVNTVTPAIASEAAMDWFTDGGEKIELAKNVEVAAATTIEDVASEVAGLDTPEIIEPEVAPTPEFVPPTADLIPDAVATKAIVAGAKIHHKLLGGGIVEDVDGDFVVVRFDRIPTEAKKIKASILTLA